MIVVCLDEMLLDVIVPHCCTERNGNSTASEEAIIMFYLSVFCRNVNGKIIIDSVSTLLLYYCHHYTLCRKMHSHLT